MLRKIGLFAWILSQSVLSLAFSATDFPAHFLIKEQKESKIIDLIQDDKKIGSLVPKSSSKGTGVYYFYDENRQRKIILRFTGFPTTLKTVMHVDVFDDRQHLIAQITYFMNINHTMTRGFEIYEPNSKTKLLTVPSSVVGNIQAAYNKDSWEEVARLYRKIFTWSLDTEVKISNSYQILNTINPDIFAAALAFYSHTYTDEMNVEPINRETYSLIETQLQQWAKTANVFPDPPNVPESVSQQVVDTLNQRYKERYDDADLADEDDKMLRFIGFAIDLLQTGVFSNEEQLALYQFLMQRLKQH